MWPDATLLPGVPDYARLRGMMSSGRETISRGRAAMVVAALSSLVFALVLTALPGIHEHLHSDAAHPQHECAITIVETGIDTGDAPLAVAAPQAVTLFSAVPALHPVWVPALFQRARIYEHAPPDLS